MNSVMDRKTARFWAIGEGYDLFIIRAPSADEALECLRAKSPGRYDSVHLVPSEIPVEGPTEVVEEYIL